MVENGYDSDSPVVKALRDTVRALDAVAAAQVDGMGALRLPGAGNFAFRRVTDPLLVPVAATATEYTVPNGFFADGGAGYQTTSFYVVNPNNCWVRLRGWSGQGNFAPVTPTMGWLFSPGFQGAFGTQYPVKMSALAVVKQGIAIPNDLAPLELIYGAGQ